MTDSRDFKYHERRQHERFDIAKVIYVEVVSAASRSEADNPIIRCETVDISIGGLRIWVPESIPEGSRLNLAVPMDDWKNNLELSARSVWARPCESPGGFWVGLELEDSGREDMERWFKVVHSLRSQPEGS
jgi:hypothetical protein